MEVSPVLTNLRILGGCLGAAVVNAYVGVRIVKHRGKTVYGECHEKDAIGTMLGLYEDVMNPAV